MQDLFAQAFVELQQKLRDESAKAFAAEDPLAVLTDLHHRPKKPPPAKKPRSDLGGGGFIRKVPLPERLLRAQQAQAREHQALQRRMDQAPKTDLSQRRKSSRKSIWNTVLEEPRRKPEAVVVVAEDTPPCTSCGSRNVQQLGSHTSRNQDVAKGEIWGTKDRGDDVMERYQCAQCGKIWSENV